MTRAQVGELPGGERRGDCLFKRDDGNPLKRQVIHPAIIAAQITKRIPASGDPA